MVAKTIQFEKQDIQKEIKPVQTIDSELELRIKKVIVDQMGVNIEEVVPEAKFVEDLGCDSLDQVELIMAFEEEFNIEINDDDAEKMNTVKDCLDYLQSRKEEFKEKA